MEDMYRFLSNDDLTLGIFLKDIDLGRGKEMIVAG